MGTITISGGTLACAIAHGDERGRCSWCGGPLPARRRRWCSEDCAHAFADNHSWPAAREAALDRAGRRCERCDRRPLTLHVHHVEIAETYGRSCLHHQANLEVLCVGCHEQEHTFRRDVERLLRWADGQIALQLVLPGVRAE